ncbi:MAG: hypothetical protein WAU68_13085 [Vitreimonas sp.]
MKTNAFIAGLFACIALAGAAAAAYGASSSPNPPPDTPNSSCVESNGICERLERIEYRLQHMSLSAASVIALTPPAAPTNPNSLQCTYTNNGLHPARPPGFYAQGQCQFANNVSGAAYLDYPPSPYGCVTGAQIGYAVGAGGVITTEYCRVP